MQFFFAKTLIQKSQIKKIKFYKIQKNIDVYSFSKILFILLINRNYSTHFHAHFKKYHKNNKECYNEKNKNNKMITATSMKLIG